jgi:hypothetical protein
MRISKQPSGRLTVGLLHLLRAFRICGVAKSGFHSLAKMTDATGNLKRNQDAVALFQRIVRARFLYDAHKFMAQDVVLFHRGNVAIVEVKVRAADRSRRHAQNNVERVLNFGIGDVLNLNVVFSLSGRSFHSSLLVSISAHAAILNSIRV